MIGGLKSRTTLFEIEFQKESSVTDEMLITSALKSQEAVNHDNDIREWENRVEIAELG